MKQSVTKNPEKVVVFDFGMLDTLDELGIEVAGLPQANVLHIFQNMRMQNMQTLVA